MLFSFTEIFENTIYLVVTLKQWAHQWLKEQWINSFSFSYVGYYYFFVTRRVWRESIKWNMYFLWRIFRWFIFFVNLSKGQLNTFKRIMELTSRSEEIHFFFSFERLGRWFYMFKILCMVTGTMRKGLQIFSSVIDSIRGILQMYWTRNDQFGCPIWKSYVTYEPYLRCDVITHCPFPTS
jgi:hypothetical protein